LADDVAPGRLQHQAIQGPVLLKDEAAHAEQGAGDRQKGRAFLEQLQDPCLELPPGDLADLEAKTLSEPRIWFSTSSSLLTRSLRLLSSIFSSWLLVDFTWTARNQPVRITCAMPRASLRSVLLVIAESAAFRWRTSMQMAGKPAAARPS
jgi:hypothetical protein